MDATHQVPQNSKKNTANYIAKEARKLKARTNPRVELDWERIRQMLKAQATQLEIAGAFNIDRETLRVRCPAETGYTWKDFSNLHKHAGHQLIREAQFEEAIKSRNPAMLIWLGKNYLGQTDKKELVTQTKPPTEIKITFQDAIPSVPHPDAGGGGEPASLANETNSVAQTQTEAG